MSGAKSFKTEAAVLYDLDSSSFFAELRACTAAFLGAGRPAPAQDGAAGWLAWKVPGHGAQRRGRGLPGVGQQRQPVERGPPWRHLTRPGTHPAPRVL